MKKGVIINRQGLVVFGATMILNMKVMAIDKTLAMEEYLNKIRLYLKDIVNNLKKIDTWEIQLTVPTNFVF